VEGSSHSVEYGHLSQVQQELQYRTIPERSYGHREDASLQRGLYREASLSRHRRPSQSVVYGPELMDDQDSIYLPKGLEKGYDVVLDPNDRRRGSTYSRFNDQNVVFLPINRGDRSNSLKYVREADVALPNVVYPPRYQMDDVDDGSVVLRPRVRGQQSHSLENDASHRNNLYEDPEQSNPSAKSRRVVADRKMELNVVYHPKDFETAAYQSEGRRSVSVDAKHPAIYRYIAHPRNGLASNTHRVDCHSAIGGPERPGDIDICSNDIRRERSVVISPEESEKTGVFQEKARIALCRPYDRSSVGFRSENRGIDVRSPKDPLNISYHLAESVRGHGAYVPEDREMVTLGQDFQDFAVRRRLDAKVYRNERRNNVHRSTDCVVDRSTVYRCEQNGNFVWSAGERHDDHDTAFLPENRETFVQASEVDQDVEGSNQEEIVTTQENYQNTAFVPEHHENRSSENPSVKQDLAEWVAWGTGQNADHNRVQEETRGYRGVERDISYGHDEAMHNGYQYQDTKQQATHRYRETNQKEGRQYRADERGSAHGHQVANQEENPSYRGNCGTNREQIHRYRDSKREESHRFYDHISYDHRQKETSQCPDNGRTVNHETNREEGERYRGDLVYQHRETIRDENYQIRDNELEQNCRNGKNQCRPEESMRENSVNEVRRDFYPSHSRDMKRHLLAEFLPNQNTPPDNRLTTNLSKSALPQKRGYHSLSRLPHKLCGMNPEIHIEHFNEFLWNELPNKCLPATFWIVQNVNTDFFSAAIATDVWRVQLIPALKNFFQTLADDGKFAELQMEHIRGDKVVADVESCRALRPVQEVWQNNILITKIEH
jgi:hypothetical protein